MVRKKKRRSERAALPTEIDYFAGSNLPVVQPSFVVSVKPWPLQAFWPLQALLALLQALWPLQALAPTQWPMASSAKATVETTAFASIKEAAAAAIAEPDLTLIFMVCSLWRVLCFHAVVCAQATPAHLAAYGRLPPDVSGSGKNI
jgi:hypothetical protein